jgi:hypothetical protein
VSIVNAAVWIPWICLVIHRWCMQGGRWWLVAGALLWAVQFLAGHPQIVVYTAIIAGLLVVSLRLQGQFRGWRVWAGLATMGIVAVLLCGVQILPTFALSGETGRSLQPQLWLFQNYHFPLAYTPLLWLPYLYGTQAHTPLDYTWWGDWNFVETAGYAGLLPWMLVPAAVCLPGGRARMGRMWATIAAISLVLAWNTDTPVGRLLFHLPVYNAFESAGRHLIGVILGLAMITGIGLDALAQATRLRARRFSRRGAWGVILLLVSVILAGIWGYEYATVHLHHGVGISSGRPWYWQRPWMVAPWAFLVPVLVGGLSAWLLCRYAAQPGSRALWPVVVILLIDVGSAGYLCAWRWRHHGTYKVQPLAPELARLLAPPGDGVSPPPRYLLFGPWGEQYAVNPQGNMLRRLASLNGYGPFQLARYHHMLAGLKHDGLVSDESLLHESRALDLWACRYVLVQEPPGGQVPSALEDSSRYQVVHQDGALRVFENLRALPHARFVGEVRVLDGEEAVLKAITTGLLPDGQIFDPRRMTLVTSDVHRRQLTESPSTEPLRGDFSVRWLACDSDRLLLETAASQSAVLLLAEPHLKGWRARLDSAEEVPIVRADYMLRAVRIPSGKHRLELRYRPAAVRQGQFASLIGFAGLVLLAVCPRRFRAS